MPASVSPKNSAERRSHSVNSASCSFGQLARRSQTMWERYHWLFVGAIALGVMQAVMIAALIAARARSRYTERRYALATAAGGVGVWDWNLETNEIYVDPFLKAALGYADHEIATHTDDWTRLVHPDDLAAVLAKAREILDGRSASYAVEHRML